MARPIWVGHFVDFGFAIIAPAGVWFEIAKSAIIRVPGIENGFCHSEVGTGRGETGFALSRLNASRGSGLGWQRQNPFSKKMRLPGSISAQSEGLS